MAALRPNSALGALACLSWVVPHFVGGAVAVAQDARLANSEFVIGLDPDEGYAFRSLVHGATGVEFIRPSDEAPADRSPWRVTVRDAEGRTFALTAADAAQASHQVDGDSLRVTWRGVRSDECPADLTVTVTGRLPEGGAKSYWRIAVDGSAPGVLWQVDFPRVFGIRPPGEDQLCLPWYWGRLWRDPTAQPRNHTLSYPQPASMQWYAYWVTSDAREPDFPPVEDRITETGWTPDRSDAAGLYWAAEDGEVYYKRFAVDTRISPRRLCWWVEHLPELDTWPVEPGAHEVSYSLPYDIAIGAFTGDYHEAAQLYLDWAKQQAWCSRGPADSWPEAMPEAGSEDLVQWVPPWFREIGFWAKFYHEPAKVLPEWAAYRKWLRVPMASHYYRYNVAVFDDNYPEHLPPDPHFTDGIRDAKDLGVRPLPYINGVIWDTDTQSWLRDSGFAAALKNEVGGIYPWDIHGDIYAYMDPGAEQWRAKMRETAGKLITEHGVSGVYLDCLTATHSMPSYDPAQPHPCHGGSWHGQGNRKLMHDLRAHIRARDPEACFFTEEIGELVIDVMDGYLTLDQWRSYNPPGMQVWPLFTCVYHPYTINFGCDAFLGQDPDLFAWEMGQMLVWGAQPLNSSIVAPPPQEGDPNSEFLREVVQAYTLAGQRFLQGGEWRRIAVRPPEGKPARCGLELIVQPHTVEYDPRPTMKRVWHGPAVMASAWDRDGDLGIVLANITGQEQPIELTVDPAKLGLDGDCRLVRTWPQPGDVMASAAGRQGLTLPARSVGIYVATTQVLRARQSRELDDTPWELVHVEDEGPLPPVEGPAGSLWACADGPVLTRIAGEGTTATAQWLTSGGLVEPRQGRQAEVRGPQAEGHGLPRDTADKPFALLRRLPHRVQGGEGEVLVLSGSEDHLLCVVPGGARLRFARSGLVVVRQIKTARLARSVADPATDAVELPSGDPCIVGYATLASDSWVGDVTSEAALAAATEAVWRKACESGSDPGALRPGTQLMTLLDQVQALASAYCLSVVDLQARHDWLTPGLTKPLSLLAWSPSGPMKDALHAELTPVGGWGTGGCEARLTGDAQDVGGSLAFPFTLSLIDAAYVERVVPVVGAMRLQPPGGGPEFTLCDVLHLEANRPFEIRKPTSVLTVAAGRSGKSGVVLRNWSPDDVTATVACDAPDGWRVEPETPAVQIAALTDCEVGVTVGPPPTAVRGSYELWCRANHLQDPAAEVLALIRVALLPALVPLTADTAAQPPAPENRARYRLAAKLVLFAEQGEPIRLSIHNYRAGNYTATGKFLFQGPDLQTLAEGSIALDESREIDLAAADTGTYYLTVEPGVGQAEVESANVLLAELATDGDPLKLFCTKVTRHFYVPAQSPGFALWAQDGGPDETCRFIVTSPTGRVVLDRDGNYAGTRMPIEVRPDEAGRVWTIRIEPRQDVSLWLTGDVCPYLSASPEAVLIEQGSR